MHIEHNLSSLSKKRIFTKIVKVYDPYTVNMLYSMRYNSKLGDIRIELMTSGFGIWQKLFTEDIQPSY
jgi:hypothetical protein